VRIALLLAVFAIAGSGVPVQSFAAIILTVENTTVEGTVVALGGPIVVNVFVRSAEPTTESLIALFVDFQIDGARFLIPPGTFGLPGMIGETGLLAPTFLNRPNDIAALSLELLNPTSELFSPTNRLLATLSIDPASVTEGVYAISLPDFGGLLTNFDNSAQGIPGTLTVTAVPEPSALLLIGGTISAGVIRLRRRKDSALA